MENAERVSRKATGIAGAAEGSGGGRLESKLSIVHMMMVFSLSAFEKMRSPCHITLIMLAIYYGFGACPGRERLPINDLVMNF